MANTFVPIYILRSQCGPCKIDTQRIFTLQGNEPPDEAFTQMEAWALKRWPKDHKDCQHTPRFARITDPEYRWNTKKKQAERVLTS